LECISQHCDRVLFVCIVHNVCFVWRVRVPVLRFVCKLFE
jgi:hypothetical protein